METKKYILIESGKSGFYRVKAVKDFGNVKAGDIGGFVKSEKNLSQVGNAWVYGNAEVSGNAEVYGNAWVYGNARVSGNARVYGNAEVYGDAEVYGNAEVSGDAWVYGNAEVYGNAWVSGNARVSGNAWVSGNARVSGKEDYIVFKNWWSSGRYFTWTRSNNRWRVGCFCGTGEELIAKAYKDSEQSGREYERVVRYVEGIINDKNERL